MILLREWKFRGMLAGMPSDHLLCRAIAAVQNRGFCVLSRHFDPRTIEACRGAFWPRLCAYLSDGHEGNRGPCRHFLPMPFEAACFAPQLFFDPDVLDIIRGLLGERVIADQWGCDVPVCGSEYQQPHVDYQRPLFPELPDLVLPPFAIVVSFGLVRIAREHGPIEIAAGAHRMTRREAIRAAEAGETKFEAIPLEVGDALIRHPWALHRGTPNTTDVPRALVTIRYVRTWYADDSREVEAIPAKMWNSLTPEQRTLMRFPVRE